MGRFSCPCGLVYVVLFSMGKQVAHPTSAGSFSIGKQIINEVNELFLISAYENIKKAVDFLTAKMRH